MNTKKNKKNFRPLYGNKKSTIELKDRYDYNYILSVLNATVTGSKVNTLNKFIEKYEAEGRTALVERLKQLLK